MTLRRFRRLALMLALVYLFILGFSIFELKQSGDTAALPTVLIWPLTPLYYMLLMGMPMLGAYLLFSASEQWLVHAGLAALSFVYTIFAFILLSGTSAMQASALKYGLITAAGIMLSFAIDRSITRLRKRKQLRQHISTFD